MRVLCLDIEGGYGGSSRSLYESVRHLHRDADIEVWCRRDGPVGARYRECGVPCRVMPTMPHISSLPRLSRNCYAFGRFALGWSRSRPFREELADAARDRFDLVHFNHEGLFLLLRWLRARLGSSMPMTIHVRTHLPSTLFSRWQYRAIADAADKVAFITENEQARASMLAGRRVSGDVIYNIVSAPDDSVSSDPALAADPRFKVAVLSNYAWNRGIDRLVDVAAVLRQRGRRDILFVVAGDMTLNGALPGALGKLSRAGGTLMDYAAQQGVADMFTFLGHVGDPSSVLAACDILAKPTREANPWGRDILEAMAYGKPPVTLGHYDRFVEDGVTGVLRPEFDKDEWADAVIMLAEDRARCRRLARAASQRVAVLCDGPSRARDLLCMWRAAADGTSDECAAS